MASVHKMVKHTLKSCNKRYKILTCHRVKSLKRRSYFWSVFSCTWTGFRDLLRKLPYSIQIQKNTDQCSVCENSVNHKIYLFKERALKIS